jgi:hypothetical protein
MSPLADPRLRKKSRLLLFMAFLLNLFGVLSKVFDF